MADNTAIEWADATINFWIGCTKVSAACDHCYAEAQAKRFGQAIWGHGETRVRTRGAIATAFRLNRKAAKRGVRLKVFTNSMSDMFDAEVPDAWRDEAFAVMALTPNLTWLVLTKRPKVMREYMASLGATMAHIVTGQDLVDRGLVAKGSNIQIVWPLPNVWLGTTAEDQKMADLRIPDLLATPAARRFLSCEPLLGEIDLRQHLVGHEEAGLVGNCIGWTPPLDWIIAGGESGPGARPMHPAWVRSLRDQCAAHGTPFFLKQWGEHEPGELIRDGRPEPWRRYPNGDEVWAFDELGKPDLPDVTFARVGKARAGRLLDGREWSETPA